MDKKNKIIDEKISKITLDEFNKWNEFDNKRSMSAWEIIEKNCKPYGGFVNVITKCGGTLVSQIWIRSMEEYANNRNYDKTRI